MTFLSRKHLSRWTVGVCLTLSLAAAARAEDLNGIWSGWMETDDFLGAIRLEIAPAGSTVTLFFAGDKRSGAIDNLKTTGRDVAFDGKLQPNGIFKGNFGVDRITGTVEILNRSGVVTGHGTWSVKRRSTTTTTPSGIPATASAEIGLVKPSGKFTIGRRLFFWTDQSRGEDLTDDAGDHRRVFVQLWYPAVKGTGYPAAYLPSEVLAADPKRGIHGIETHAFANADAAKGSFPLIVFSPGLGVDPLMYTSIIEELVSNGYFVAAIDHPYDAGPVVWPDGTKVQQSNKWDVKRTDEERRRFFDTRRIEWAKDASFVVDQVKELDMAANIDAGRLGMLGHSFGGQAASIVCASDKRFKACANLDGLAQGNAVLPSADGKTMTQPFLFFTKAASVTDAELQMMGMSRSEYSARERKRLAERWKPGFKNQIAGLPSGGYVIVYPGIDHMTFSDEPLVQPSTGESLTTRGKRAAIIDRYVVAFFDQQLRGKRSAMLNSPDPRSGLLIEFLKK